VFPTVAVTSSSQPGEIAADFEGFYALQRVPAMRFAFLMCGDQALAEEIAAEALAKVFKSWQRQAISDPEAYLRRAVVNEVRSRGRRRILERREQQRHTVRPVSADSAERSADHHILTQAVLRLPVHQRAPIVLRYFEDLSETDTAIVLGKSIGTVKSSVTRGLARLRDLLGEEQIQ